MDAPYSLTDWRRYFEKFPEKAFELAVAQVIRKLRLSGINDHDIEIELFDTFKHLIIYK